MFKTFVSLLSGDASYILIKMSLKKPNSKLCKDKNTTFFPNIQIYTTKNCWPGVVPVAYSDLYWWDVMCLAFILFLLVCVRAKKQCKCQK
jgi:hypothetical protein